MKQGPFFHRRLAVVCFALCLVILFPSCCSLLTYAGDRALDLTDIVDLKYCCPGVLAIGARAEATVHFAPALGFGGIDWATEYFGRRDDDDHGGAFLFLLIWGVENFNIDNQGVQNVLGFGAAEDYPPVISQFRFGGEIYIPGLNFGLYLNAGEVIDLILGFATIDLADDDGLPKGSPLHKNASDPEYRRYDFDDALAALKDPSPAIRRKGAQLLGVMKNPQAVQALVDAMGDEDEQVREQAILSLIELDDRRVAPAFINALRDPCESVWMAANRGLQKMTGVDHGRDRGKWHEWFWDHGEGD